MQWFHGDSAYGRIDQQTSGGHQKGVRRLREVVQRREAPDQEDNAGRGEICFCSHQLHSNTWPSWQKVLPALLYAGCQSFHGHGHRIIPTPAPPIVDRHVCVSFDIGGGIFFAKKTFI